MREIIFDLWAKHSAGILDIGRRLLITLIVIAGGRFAAFLADRLINKAGVEKFKLDESAAIVLKTVINYGTVVVCVIMILEIFGFNTTSLIALLGAAGIAVGLALKDTLSNIASGIIILFLRPFRKGDFIEFGAFMGAVKEINLFSTILETPDGVNVSSPNSCVWNAPLKNYSQNQKRRMELSVRISYADSIDAAFGVFREIVNQEKRFLSDPAPQILVQSMGDYGVNIMLRAWAPAAAYWDVYWEHMRGIKEKIEAAGLSIPVPQREIRVINEK